MSENRVKKDRILTEILHFEVYLPVGKKSSGRLDDIHPQTAQYENQQHMITKWWIANITIKIATLDCQRLMFEELSNGATLFFGS